VRLLRVYANATLLDSRWVGTMNQLSGSEGSMRSSRYKSENIGNGIISRLIPLLVTQKSDVGKG
jgi:hypothetical protein